MPRKENEDVSEGEGPILLQLLSGGTTLENFHRMWSEKIEKTFDKYIGIIRITYEESSRSTEVGLDSGRDNGGTDQREVCQEQNARQPRLAMEADGPANTKTRERTEGAPTAVQTMRGDSCSADRVDLDPMFSTSSGDDYTGPPAPLCSRENALVYNRAAAPKSCLPSLEIRSPTAAVATGEASTATNATYDETPRRLYAIEETNPKKKI